MGGDMRDGALVGLAGVVVASGGGGVVGAR